MKKNLLFVAFSLFYIYAAAQPCNSNTHFRTLGTSSNILSLSNNGTNPISFDSATHSITFIHRNNTVLFGGNTGGLRYDVSSDTGNTWTNNLGLLNPGLVSASGGRYPQGLNYHPSGATSYTGNFLVYHAPTTSGTNFNGYVSGVRKLNNNVNTEHYNQGGINYTNVPSGLCKGAGNTFWTVDVKYDSATATYSTIRILKGVFSNNDVTWSLNKSLSPSYNLNYDGKPHIPDWDIAFDPSGLNGWVVILSHLTGAEYKYAPVFYKTNNGGTTWTGPYEVSLGSFPVVNGIIEPGYYASSGFEVAIAVDALGHPHALMQACSATGADYAITNSLPMIMIDVTFDGSAWSANYLKTCYALRGTVGSGASVVHDNTPQTTMSQNGDIIGLLWSDTPGAAAGGANDFPDLFGVFYSVSSNTYSGVYDFTSCTNYGGNILFPHVAPTLIYKGKGVYQVPVVFAQLNASGSELDPVTYYFINDLLVNSCSFSSFTASVSPSGPVSFCQGDSVMLSVPGSYCSYLWSNGASSSSVYVKQNGSYKVTVSNGNGCTVSTANVAVSTTGAPAVTISSVGNPQFCPGSSVTLNASSANATTFKWRKNGVNISGANSSSYQATSSATYTCYVTGTCGNNLSNGITTTKLTAPVAAITPADTVTVCAGDTVLLTANTVSNATYKWYKGSVAISGSNSKTYKATSQANYRVKITKTTTGCATTSDPTYVLINCREESDWEAESIFIFPNPANDLVNIELNDADNARIALTDLAGRKINCTVENRGVNLCTLDLSSLNKGVYFISITTNNKTVTKKLLLVD